MLSEDYSGDKLAIRFWNKVAVSAPEDCWLWTANSLKGRGLFKVGKKNEYAPLQI